MFFLYTRTTGVHKYVIIGTARGRIHFFYYMNAKCVEIGLMVVVQASECGLAFCFYNDLIYKYKV